VCAGPRPRCCALFTASGALWSLPLRRPSLKRRRDNFTLLTTSRGLLNILFFSLTANRPLRFFFRKFFLGFSPPPFSDLFPGLIFFLSFPLRPHFRSSASHQLPLCGSPSRVFLYFFPSLSGPASDKRPFYGSPGLAMLVMDPPAPLCAIHPNVVAFRNLFSHTLPFVRQHRPPLSLSLTIEPSPFFCVLAFGWPE